eukprot:Phypoly_transcript_00127.p1 GENE.Phypoly_transcript_00127~~Phypoly_transcript_00127.p1  ORF type:complete len:1925 (+),score=277.93 Phypoly_transcript_00127:754-5775(+)
MAYPRALPQFFHWFLRTLMVLAYVVLLGHPAQHLVNAVLGSLALYNVLYYRTHYIPQIDSIQVGVKAGFVWLSIMNLFVMFFFEELTTTLSAFVISGFVLCIIIGYKASQIQFASYGDVHDIEQLMESNQPPKFQSEREAYLCIRYHLWETSRNNVFKESPEKRKGPAKLTFLCQSATELFPNSPSIHNVCAIFYMNIIGDYTKTLTQLKFAHQNLGPFDVDLRFALVIANARRYQLIFETYKENSAEFCTKYTWVRRNELEAKRRTQLFWKTLMRSNINAERLFSLTEDISVAFKRTDTLYKNMLRLFPSSPILLRAYAHFLSEMNCDYDTAELLNSWAYELEATKDEYSNKQQQDAKGFNHSDVSSSDRSLTTGLPRQSKRMAFLSESSFSSKAARFLSTRLGVSLLVLAMSSLVMFGFTNSLFSVYKQNVSFLHSSGVASHMVEKILLDVQDLRTAHVRNDSSSQAKYVLDLETHSHKLSAIHKQLYLFQKHQLGVLTEYYEKPAFDVPAPTNWVVNYYDLVNIFSSSARELAYDINLDFGTHNPDATKHYFIMRYGPTAVAPGLSHAGSLLRDQNQDQAATRRGIFFVLMVFHIISVVSTLVFILFPIERSIMDERNSIIKLFKSISADLSGGVLASLKKTDIRDFEIGVFKETQGNNPAALDTVASRMQFKPHKRQQPMEKVFRRYYYAVLPLLIICCLLNFNISYNVEIANAQVSTEIFLSSERLSATNQLHFFYRELTLSRSVAGNKSEALGAHVWPEEGLRKMIDERLTLLERTHYELRFGTKASIGRHSGQYRLANEPVCVTLGDPEVTCDNALLRKYHLEEFGLDELFFRFLELCKRIEKTPGRMDELDFLDWLLSKALYQSMNFYVEETKQLLYNAEVSQYVIFFTNISILLLLYVRAVFFISATLSSALSRCRALFLMLPDTALDSSPYIREFLATGVASVEEHVLGAGLPIWQRIVSFANFWSKTNKQKATGPLNHSVQSLSLPFISISSNFRITGMNEQAEKLLGYQSSELLGEDVEAIFDKKKHDIKATLKDMFMNSEPAVLPMQKKKDGIMMLHVHASKVESHEVEYVLILGCDVISYINEAKEMLDKALHFQAIFATVSESIVVCSNEGQIQMINSKAQKLFGYPEASIKGKPIDFLLPHQGISEHLSSPNREEYAIPLGRREGTALNIALNQEATCLCASGGEVPVEVSITKFWIYRDSPPTVVLLIRDMSLRKQMEKSYMSAQKEKAANVAKSVFLANMSHELRTPLNGIILTSQLLAGANLGPEYQEYIETISCCADSLFSLINDILDFSKIEAGKLEMEESVFNIVETVEEVVSSVSPQACEKGVELIAVVDPQIPRFLRGDSRRLRQVLLNFLSNAVKFTSIGHVLVTNQLKLNEAGIVEILFKVSDTGIGIRESQLNQLFSRFSQLDMSSTRQYHGSGLGLAISKELVNMLGGKIGVDSEFGRGSTFWFTCKFAVDSTVDSGKARALDTIYAHKLQDVVVIVLVQNLVLCDVICQYLKMWRVRYYAVDSLQTAIPYINTRSPSQAPPVWVGDQICSDTILEGVKNEPVFFYTTRIPEQNRCEPQRNPAGARERQRSNRGENRVHCADFETPHREKAARGHPDRPAQIPGDPKKAIGAADLKLAVVAPYRRAQRKRRAPLPHHDLLSAQRR